MGKQHIPIHSCLRKWHLTPLHLIHLVLPLKYGSTSTVTKRINVIIYHYYLHIMSIKSEKDAKTGQAARKAEKRS